MTVRAKLLCGWGERGKVGSYAHFNAVYEGSEDLQLVSENSIFGSATPTANLSLTGDVPSFKVGEEYYVDIFSTEETRPDDLGFLLVATLRKTYRSALNPNLPKNPISFRFAIEGGGHCDVAGEFNMAIANPSAIEALDDGRYFVMGVKLARGRRSDAEIAAIGKMLDQSLAEANGTWDNPPRHYDPKTAMRGSNGPEMTREEFIEWRCGALRRKLAIAKGEITD